MRANLKSGPNLRNLIFSTLVLRMMHSTLRGTSILTWALSPVSRHQAGSRRIPFKVSSCPIGRQAQFHICSSRTVFGDSDVGRRNIIAIWSQGVDKLGKAKPVSSSGKGNDEKGSQSGSPSPSREAEESIKTPIAQFEATDAAARGEAQKNTTAADKEARKDTPAEKDNKRALAYMSNDRFHKQRALEEARNASEPTTGKSQARYEQSSSPTSSAEQTDQTRGSKAQNKSSSGKSFAEEDEAAHSKSIDTGAHDPFREGGEKGPGERIASCSIPQKTKSKAAKSSSNPVSSQGISGKPASAASESKGTGEKEVKVEEVKVKVEAKAREIVDTPEGEKVTYKKIEISHHEILPTAEQGEQKDEEAGGPRYNISADDPMRDPFKGSPAGITIERLSFMPPSQALKGASSSKAANVPGETIDTVDVHPAKLPPQEISRAGAKDDDYDTKGFLTKEDFESVPTPDVIHDAVVLPDESTKKGDQGKSQSNKKSSEYSKSKKNSKIKETDSVDQQPSLSSGWPKAPPKDSSYAKQKSPKSSNQRSSDQESWRERDGERWEDKPIEQKEDQGFHIKKVKGSEKGTDEKSGRLTGKQSIGESSNKGMENQDEKSDQMSHEQSSELGKENVNQATYDEPTDVGKPPELHSHKKANSAKNFSPDRPDSRAKDTRGGKPVKIDELHPEFNAPKRASQRARNALTREVPHREKGSRKEELERPSHEQKSNSWAKMEDKRGVSSVGSGNITDMKEFQDSEYDFKLKVEAVPSNEKRSQLGKKKSEKQGTKQRGIENEDQILEDLKELEEAIDKILLKVKAKPTQSSARPKDDDGSGKKSGDTVTQDDVCHDFGHAGPQKHHSVAVDNPSSSSDDSRKQAKSTSKSPTFKASTPSTEPPGFSSVVDQSKTSLDPNPIMTIDDQSINKVVQEVFLTAEQQQKEKERNMIQNSSWWKLWSGWGKSVPQTDGSSVYPKNLDNGASVKSGQVRTKTRGQASLQSVPFMTFVLHFLNFADSPVDFEGNRRQWWSPAATYKIYPGSKCSSCFKTCNSFLCSSYRRRT